MRGGIEEDKVWQITIGENRITVSKGTSDHAVRYAGQIAYMDHLVTLDPVSGEDPNGEEITLYLVRRWFLGAAAIDHIVDTTGIGEVYLDNVSQSVKDSYDEWEIATLEAELGGSDEE